MSSALRFTLWFLAFYSCALPVVGASLVFTNGNLYTANDVQPRAEAVVVENGRITFVGTAVEALKRAPKQAKRIDLQGRAMFPGFVDAHAHLLGIGERELSFNLEGATSLVDMQARLRKDDEPGHSCFVPELKVLDRQIQRTQTH